MGGGESSSGASALSHMPSRSSLMSLHGKEKNVGAGASGEDA